MIEHMHKILYLYRNNTSEKDGSIKQPDQLNYGYTQPGEDSIFKKMRAGIRV